MHDLLWHLNQGKKPANIAENAYSLPVETGGRAGGQVGLRFGQIS